MWRIFFSVSSFSLYEIQTLLYFSPRCKASEKERSRVDGELFSASSPAAAWKYFHQTSEIAIRSTENFAALFSPQLGRKLLSWWLSEAILLSLCWVSDFSRSKRWCVCRFLLIKNADRGKINTRLCSAAPLMINLFIRVRRFHANRLSEQQIKIHKYTPESQGFYTRRPQKSIRANFVSILSLQ